MILKYIFRVILIISLTVYCESVKLKLLKRSVYEKFELFGDTLPDEWFTQFLDHFNPTEARTWKQRYLVNEEHYKKEGPIFLILGGEAPVDSDDLSNSFVIYLAEQFGALLVTLEHRYYGQSKPTPDLDRANMQYLSSEQALADTAYFIQEMQRSRFPSSSSKWIVFGDSYAGSLAVWMQLKYSYLVHGAVADSAPLAAQIEFTEYYSDVEKLFKKHSTACVEILNIALRDIYTSLYNATGQNKLTNLFNLCQPINLDKASHRNVSSIFVQFLDIVSHIALTDGPPTIKQSCDILVDEKRGIAINKLAAVFDLVLEANQERCFFTQTYDERLAELRNVTWNDYFSARSTIYQMCTELGWFVSTKTRPFNVSSDCLSTGFFKQLCNDVFGPGFPKRMYQGIKRTNIVYGGFNVGDEISNVILVYGSDDPWRNFGILQSDNSNISCIYLQDVGNCPLKNQPSESDTPQVAEAKNKVKSIIYEWLQKT